MINEEPEAHVADAVAGLAAGTRDEQMAATREVLGVMPPASAALGAAMVAFMRSDDLLAEIDAYGPDTLATACQSGCAWCCYVGHAAVSVPEAVAIAQHVAALEEEQAARIQARLEDAAERAQSLSIHERWMLRDPCPFLDLDEARCRVYEVRPVRCRGWNSLDASACEAGFEDRGAGIDVPTNRLRFAVGTSTEEGQQAAFASAGLDARRGRIAEAVLLAMAEPDLSERWAAGEAIFDGICADEEG
ncbi:MAG: YkgJ family cysteine cluster protein [Myxococcales bacterium]|nr:YkgJ family cysteine cluster protein [Myxococcales bacterium]